MKHSRFIFVVFVAALPFSSYLFLDQISLRRAEDFASKWYAREAPGFGDLDTLIESYEDVIFASGDLKAIGVLHNSQVVKSIGDANISPDSLKTSESANTTRAGFLRYVTTVAIPDSQGKSVYFVFSDDSALLDFALLVLAMAIVMLSLLFARAKVEKQKARITKETTLLTIRSLAHDLRAPFAKLSLLLNLSQQNKNHDDYQLAEFRSDLHRVLQLADGMLFDFLNLDNQNEPIEPVDIALVIDNLEKTYFRDVADNLNIKLSIECNASVIALGNSQKCTRILMNLLDNAFKHARTQVALRSWSTTSQVHVSINNDGPTIAAKDADNIFEPFYSGRKGGFGLGLFICANFAKAQGGSITCKSQDNTTVFTLSLPKTEPVTDHKKQQTLVAFVDDELFYRKLIEDALSKGGIQVQTYLNTDLLLTKLRDKTIQPDLILVDRFAPDFDVLENRFAESCRDYGYRGPIVLYSNSVQGHETFDQIFRAIDKSTLLNTQDIFNLIKEYKNESQ